MRLPAFVRLPTRKEILKKRPLGRFTHYLARPMLWHPHRHSVARAAAIGTFIGSLPFFGQVFSILLLSLWRRAYIPVGVAMPFVVTGPLTIIPFFFACYELGFWLLTQLGIAPAITIHYRDIHQIFHGDIGILAMGDRLWHAYLVTWIGSLILGTALALLAYFGIMQGWRIWVIWRMCRRRLRQTRAR